MLRFASSLGRSRCVGDHGTCLQSCRDAPGCAAAARTRKRRSSPARTTAEISIADLSRPAHGVAVGMHLDCDGIADDARTVLASVRLRAPEDAAQHTIVDDSLALVGDARDVRLCAGRHAQPWAYDG